MSDKGDGQVTESERKLRLAYAIRTAREARSMTPPQLAEKLNISRGTVNKWEAGEAVPSLLMLGPLSEALGVDPTLFVELPAVPDSPIRRFLRSALAEGVHEGLVRSRQPRARREP